MRLLFLGGTQFLGRHAVDAALARGHAVTVFTRGRNPIPAGVTSRNGDRDPRISPGLAALEGERFDAVIDTSGYLPRVVAASAALLARNVGRYLFVSSISVYAKLDRPDLDESAELAVLPDPSTEDVPAHYGALKAACEAVVSQSFGDRATLVRPGLIVGPHDSTDRFGYWPARFIHPKLLGDRGAEAVVPAPPERPIQMIDVRDLAEWIVELCERDGAGTFNAASPARQWRFGDLVDACVAEGHDAPAPISVPERVLADYHVEPWVGLPLWMPSSEPDSRGFLEANCERARRAGLRTRPLAVTVRDTAAWLLTRDNAGAWKKVLTDARERQIVSAMRQH